MKGGDTMKRYLSNAILGFALLALGSPAFGADYSSYSTEELSQMRGTLYNASQEEREAFRAEWQKRLQEMTPDERRTYTGPPPNRQRSNSNNSYGRRYRRGGGMGMYNRP